MSRHDWKWKINEAIERVRTRYDFIGRKTGAPFLSIIYPQELEREVLKEWHTQCATLSPEFEARVVDALEVTQRSISEIGSENIVSSMEDPMPGSDPQSELGEIWINAICDEVKLQLAKSGGGGRPFASLERLAAIFPAAGPRDVMQRLWDCAQSELNGPVVVLIPGHRLNARTYSFLSQREEFMYRGDPL